MTSFNGVDWTERKPFLSFGNMVYLTFNELLTLSRKPFDLLISSFCQFQNRDDLWQMCSIKCMHVYQNVECASIGMFFSVYRHVMLGFIRSNRRQQMHECSLDEPQGESGRTPLEIIAVYDEPQGEKASLDWSAFTNEENELIDCILRGEPYSRRTATFFSLLHKLEQWQNGEPMCAVPLTASERTSIQQAKTQGSQPIRRYHLVGKSKDVKNARKRAWYNGLTPEQRKAYHAKNSEWRRQYRARKRAASAMTTAPA